MLPHTAHHQRSYSRSSLVPEYVWRIFNLSQMDFQTTYAQLIDLIRAPRQVYKTTAIRKQIKNQWARDDPAFVVVLCVFIVMASLAYSVAFGVLHFFHFLRIVLGIVCIEFLLFGFIIASVVRSIANKYMRSQRVMSTEQDVEWLYAFDVHCNGFFPAFLWMFVLQYFLSPFLIADDFVAAFFANTLYLIAGIHYVYIMFLGYSALPYLDQPERFLYPIGIFVICYLIGIILKINIAKFVLDMYFGE